MLFYTNRTREVYLALKGKYAARELYDALDFHREPNEDVTNEFKAKNLQELCGLSKRHFYTAIQTLRDLELIMIMPAQKSHWKFKLLKLNIKKIVPIDTQQGVTEDVG